MTCYRLIHGFTFAGMLPSQYYHLSQFSVIGVVGCWYVQVGEQYKVLWNLSLCLVYVKSTGMEGTVHSGG